MSDTGSGEITAAVIERVSAAADLRTREISVALIRHLHAFIREIEPTEQEWHDAIRFLTAVGQKCSQTRQEFILLSDTLGVSMLVDAINNRDPGVATESTVLGPFFVEGAPHMEIGQDLARGVDGEPLRVDCHVVDSAGRPIEGATVDIWHSDADGSYDVQKADDEMSLRGRFHSGSDGHIGFLTVVPRSYPIPDDGPVGQMLRAQGRHPYRPAHIHFMIGAAGYRTLVTHLFIAGDPYLGSDAVFGVKRSLICELADDPECAGRKLMSYRFVLRG